MHDENHLSTVLMLDLQIARLPNLNEHTEQEIVNLRRPTPQPLVQAVCRVTVLVLVYLADFYAGCSARK